MEKELLYYWVWFTRLKGISLNKKKRLIKYFSTPKKIFDCSEQLLQKLKDEIEIKEKDIKEIKNNDYKKGLDGYLEYMKKNNIELITQESKYYPEKLKHIYDSPLYLYIKGNKKILNDFSLAIIGSRNYSQYGKEVALKISEDLSKKGIITVSGLAIGIDSFVHISSVKNKAKTIAVIGNGLDNIYPYTNKELVYEIIKNGGAILSEYPLGSLPEKLHFPERNRIISGIADGVIVIEAAKKSGTMITVDFALEQGKNVFSIPGNITLKNSEGTNELIKQGAKLITNVDDILEEY